MLPPTRFQITVSCLSIDCVRGLNEMREMINKMRSIHGTQMDEQRKEQHASIRPILYVPTCFFFYQGAEGLLTRLVLRINPVRIPVTLQAN